MSLGRERERKEKQEGGWNTNRALEQEGGKKRKYR